jgi:hypothetical protein
MRIMKNVAIPINLLEYESFNDDEILKQRKMAIKQQISQAPQCETYDVFSQIKYSWRIRRQ